MVIDSVIWAQYINVTNTQTDSRFAIANSLREWVSRGLTSHSTLYRSFRGRFSRSRWPNQQRQSTEGGQLVTEIGFNSLHPGSKNHTHMNEKWEDAFSHKYLKERNKRKTRDNVTRSSDDQEWQPKIWTTERNGSVQRRLVLLEYWTAHGQSICSRSLRLTSTKNL